MSKATVHSSTLSRRAVLAGVSSSTALALTAGAAVAAVLPSDGEPDTELLRLERELDRAVVVAAELGAKADAIVAAPPKGILEAPAIDPSGSLFHGVRRHEDYPGSDDDPSDPG